jgi:tetratricopeptide (TPR) repeat protein
MTHLPRLKRLIIIIMLLPIVLSCAEMKNWFSSKDLGGKWQPADDTSSSSGRAADLAQNHMAAGEYQKAIDVYNEAYQKQPDDQTLMSAYVKSLDTMAAAADKAFDKQDFGPAGKTYDLLLKNDALFQGFNKELSFNSAFLNEQLDFCKKALFKQGFQEYRQGNLDQAIMMWQDLLAIDPHNSDIQEALRTAKLQQQTLREQD